MIIVHEYPLLIVENKWFKKIANGLNPLFMLVSRNTVKKDCFRIFDVEKVVVMHMLDALGQHNLVNNSYVDFFNPTKGFMMVTTQFIDANWKLQSPIIRYKS